MGRHSQPLPPGLGDTFASRRAAQWQVGPGRLRHRDLSRPARGVRSLAPPIGLIDQVRAIALVLPRRAVFSHDTAARLLGLPTPLGGDPLIHVTLAPDAFQIVRPGLVGHRADYGKPVLVKGVRVTSPLRTWSDLTAVGRLEDSVAIADVLLRRGTSRTLVQREVDRRRGCRGVRALRQAAALARPEAESPMESWARVMIILAGLPEPELQVDIVTEDGIWLARCDFVWREQRVIVEFDGDQHRTDRAQWQLDVRRYRDLREEGWTVLTITADDILVTPVETVALIDRALTRNDPPDSA